MKTKPIIDNQVDFSQATRRALFKPKLNTEITNGLSEVESSVLNNIPGAGSSAAKLPERHVRYKVTMNLDGDLLAYFKAEGSKIGRPYQVLINQALREYVEGSNLEQMAERIGELLVKDPNFITLLKDTVNK